MRKKLSTIVLAVTTGLLLVGAIYVSLLLKQEPGEQAATTIKKTKAANKTYLLAFNLSPLTPTQEPEMNGASQIPPTVTPATSPVPLLTDDQITPNITVTPTEILLAQNNVSPTTSLAISEGTVNPTKIQDLPQTGWTQYSLIIFAVAATVFFVSFMF